MADDHVPVAVDLVLVIGGYLEREYFAMFESIAAIEADLNLQDKGRACQHLKDRRACDAQADIGRTSALPTSNGITRPSGTSTQR